MNKLFALFVLPAIGASMMLAPAAFAQDVVVEEQAYSVSTGDPEYMDEDPALAPDEDDALIIRDDEEAALDDLDDDGDAAATVVAETVITGDDDAMDRCAARYRSFDPDTGTYLGYDGLTHTCPYLR